MRRFLVAITTLLISACSPDYGGACQTIPLGSRLDEYPHGEVTQLTSGDSSWASGFIAATPELQCCDVGRREPCTSAPCKEVLARLRSTQLSGRYINGPCQSVMMGTTMYCAAFVDERDRIVALKTFCQD